MISRWFKVYHSHIRKPTARESWGIVQINKVFGAKEAQASLLVFLIALWQFCCHNPSTASHRYCVMYVVHSYSCSSERYNWGMCINIPK